MGSGSLFGLPSRRREKARILKKPQSYGQKQQANRANSFNHQEVAERRGVSQQKPCSLEEQRTKLLEGRVWFPGMATFLGCFPSGF